MIKWLIYHNICYDQMYNIALHMLQMMTAVSRLMRNITNQNAAPHDTQKQVTLAHISFII